MRPLLCAFVALCGCGRGVGQVEGCGDGTHLEGGRCYPDTPGLTCGAGTVEQGGQCVSALRCGDGTTQQGMSCVPPGFSADGGWYEVRIGATQVPADGFSKIPVLALGRLPDGGPATTAVVLSVDRSGAGTLQMPGLTLGTLGTTTYFTPCNSANNPLCVGPAHLELRLSSDPTHIISTSQQFNLVAPEGVGSTAPCDPYANALFFDGAGYIFTGTQLVTMGTFDAQPLGLTPTHVSLRIFPSSSAQGSWWSADFAAPSGAGPLAEQVYSMAERYPFQPPSVAGLDVSGDGRGCNLSSGRFQIERLTLDGRNQLKAFTATFEQFCENAPGNVLRGCVKYTQAL